MSLFYVKHLKQYPAGSKHIINAAAAAAKSLQLCPNLCNLRQ